MLKKKNVQCGWEEVSETGRAVSRSSFPRAAVIKYHGQRGEKQQKFIVYNSGG